MQKEIQLTDKTLLVVGLPKDIYDPLERTLIKLHCFKNENQPHHRQKYKKIEKMKTGIEKIDEICKAVIGLTKQDFKEVEDLYVEQSSASLFSLNPKKSNKLKLVSENNKRNLEALKSLKDSLEFVKIVKL